MGYLTSEPPYSLMSTAHLWCDATSFADSPMTLTLRFLKSSSRRATSANSVVQTGVKSSGCEKRMTWKSASVSMYARKYDGDALPRSHRSIHGILWDLESFRPQSQAQCFQDEESAAFFRSLIGASHTACFIRDWEKVHRAFLTQCLDKWRNLHSWHEQQRKETQSTPLHLSIISDGV
jgi:hypothetical protein